MATTVTQSQAMRATVEIPDELVRAMKRSPEIAAEALQKASNYWHEKILPKHFERGAAARYGYAKRSVRYLQRKQRHGNAPPLQFDASRPVMKNDLVARAQFKMTKNTVELKMFSRVLNLVPTLPENSMDHYVKQKGGRSYPNLKREIKAITEDEREALATVIVAELERAFSPAGQPTQRQMLA